MKTLEIEAALDTAEETRKKIVELTSEKQRVINVCLFFLISLATAIVLLTTNLCIIMWEEENFMPLLFVVYSKRSAASKFITS